MFVMIVTSGFCLLLVALVFSGRTKHYVVDALSESVYLTQFEPGSQWRIDGFKMCTTGGAEDQFAEEDLGCIPVELPTEPLLTLTCATEANLQRLGGGPLEIQLRAIPPASGGRNGEAFSAPTCSAVTAYLESFGDDSYPRTELDGTMLLTSASATIMPLQFRARAIIGQVPAAGTRGLLQGGTASLFQGGKLDGNLYLLQKIDLVLGDVVSLPEGTSAANMHGVVRPAPTEGIGLHIAYIGNDAVLQVDRMRTVYRLDRPWTAVLLLDPLILVILTLFALISSFSGTLAFLFGGPDTANREKRDPRVEPAVEPAQEPAKDESGRATPGSAMESTT